MAVFVDLGDEDNGPREDGQPVWNGPVDPLKPVPVPVPVPAAAAASGSLPPDGINAGNTGKQREEAHGLAVRESLNNNSMTQALGCYP
jgi:hypothetical protein